jgi:cytochrome c peroxidase
VKLPTWRLIGLSLVVVAAAAGTRFFSASESQAASAPLGLPPLPAHFAPDLTPERIALGKKLFFDRRLSANGTMSCAMCHLPEEGFTSNASKLSVGMEGKSLRRNAPTLQNVAYQASLFHDGRESSLAQQAWLPLLHTDEMANPSIGMVLDKLSTHLPDYAGQFERAFGGTSASMETVGRALAAFQATLLSANSRFDQYQFAQARGALSDEEKRGLALFLGGARCVQCHSISTHHALFIDQQFHVTGAGLLAPQKSFVVPLAPGIETTLTDADLAAFATPNVPDLGRFEITRNAADRYAFRTPTLRNIALTAPYMHDGSLETLEDVIAFYNRGGNLAPGKSPLITPLGLNDDESRALVQFLKALTGDAISARQP